MDVFIYIYPLLTDYDRNLDHCPSWGPKWFGPKWFGLLIQRNFKIYVSAYNKKKLNIQIKLRIQKQYKNSYPLTKYTTSKFRAWATGAILMSLQMAVLVYNLRIILNMYYCESKTYKVCK